MMMIKTKNEGLDANEIGAIGGDIVFNLVKNSTPCIATVNFLYYQNFKFCTLFYNFNSKY